MSESRKKRKRVVRESRVDTVIFSGMGRVHLELRELVTLQPLINCGKFYPADRVRVTVELVK